MITPERIAELRATYFRAPTVLALLDEIERLRAVIQWTHDAYCTPPYTDRGLHAPECRIAEIEP